MVTVKTKQRRCRTCKCLFTPQKANPRRANCFSCRPANARPGGAPPLPPEDDEPVPPPVPRGPGPIEAATAHELARVKRVTTVSGAIAMRLARVMDDPDLSEARLTALAAQLERTLEKATAGTPPPPDDLDARQERIRLIQDTA